MGLNGFCLRSSVWLERSVVNRKVVGSNPVANGMVKRSDKNIRRLHSEIASHLIIQSEITGAEPVATTGGLIV